MLPTQKGAFPLFRLFGIQVYLHWSWFLVAAWRFQHASAWSDYRSPIFYVAEYLALFGIVTMHEFGHSLACRQVGGWSDQIVIWPLGGVAYVMPPDRPGAQLWSLAAGPLVNVALVPVLGGLVLLERALGLPWSGPDTYALTTTIFFINLMLLCFNMLPFYPLDGGQILRSLLWYAVGRGRSLLIATPLGMAGAVALGFWGLSQGGWWLALIGAFLFMGCWQGFQRGRALRAQGL